MPSKKQYNLVHNDEYDTRIPLHSEEAFHRGIVFHAKFIGSMDVPRPTSRVEIVAAMRRIRYEFKAKGIKKKKVSLEVSVDGLKVSLRKKKKKQQWIDENKAFQMHYPIYRIFYVSHDSHDLKIFSYIARDGNSNSFKCNVFKSSKKSQAMRVVRTVGQAFEVCHKLSLNAALEDQEVEKERARVRGADDHLHRSDDYDDQDEVTNERQIRRPRSTSPNVHKDISLLDDVEEVREQTPTLAPCILRTHGSSASPIRQINLSPSGNAASESGDHLLLGGGETTALRHEIQLLRERLEQQGQQTRAAVAHARLLQDQLAAEAAARVEAQTRTHQLLIQNKELLEHIGALVSHLRDQEHGCSVGHTGATTGQSQVSGGTNLSGMTPQTSTIPDLSSLGQSQGITPGQSSPWELEATPSASSFPYCAYPSETLYQGILSGVGGLESTTDQLHFQTQLLERLHNLSPYQQQQRSPYGTPTTPCYALGAPSFLLSPSSNKPPSSLNVPSSPGGLSLRVSPQANSYASSPVMSHKTSSSHGTSLAESPESLVETVAASFIKPLPCSSPGSRSSLLHVPSVKTNVASFEAGNKSTVDHQQLQQQNQQPRRITLEAPPAGKRKEAKSENMHRSSSSPPRDPGCNETRERGPPSIKSSLASALRSSGPAPSRTTSARLPPRNDLMCQVQRTTWARHTTK